MNEKQRRQQLRQIAIVEALYILALGACISLAAVAAMLMFGG